MTDEVPSLAGGLRLLAFHLPRRRRLQAAAILCFMLVGALAEMTTIGAIVPFLALMADPKAAQSYPAVGKFFAALGWTDPTRLVVPAAILFCAVAVIAAAIRIALTRASQKFVFRVGHDLSLAVYEGILHQPYSFHVSHNTSEILSGITKVQQVLGNVLMPLMLACSSLTISSFIFAALLTLNAEVALLSGFGFGFIYVAVATSTRRRLRRNSTVIAKSQTGRIRTVQEGLGGIRDVLIDHAQGIYLNKFDRLDSELRDAQAANALIAATPRYVVESAGMILIAALALMLSDSVGGLSRALPVLGALALAAQRLLPLLQQMYNAWAQVLGNRQVIFDVLKLLQRRQGLDFKAAKPSAPLPFERAIEIRDVSFRYGAGPVVLRGIDLTIPKGSRIAFIGKTGSGKSTIMDLVMGLLDPTTGQICVDGVPISTQRAAWQTQIAHVPQAIYLSDASIAENIAFGIEPALIDPSRLEDAARKADIHDFIMGLDEQYQTEVGERGVRLSGGQRQRIGIARALYKQSKILIFDEATSALDDDTEAAIMHAIDKLGRDLTMLTIAHRLSTVRNCDRIYRLSAGRIEMSGKFDEVVAKPGAMTG